MIRTYRSVSMHMYFCMTMLFCALCILGLISFASAEKLIIPERTTRIESMAFCGDTSLDEVVLPDGIQYIDYKAFAYSSVKKINLPSSIQDIADNAFMGCHIEQVIAEEGTYEYDWAVEHGLIPSSLGLVTIHVPETIQAGEDLTISFDPVDGANYYYGWIYNENTGSELGFSDDCSGIFYGYDLYPGSYTISVIACDWINNISTTSVTEIEVIGERPPAPRVVISNDHPKPDEEYYITIDTTGADLLYGSNIWRRYINDENTCVFNECKTKPGQYNYRYCVRRNSIWSEWSEPVTALVLNNPDDPLHPDGNPEIIIPENPIPGKDMIIEVIKQDGVSGYSGEISFSDNTYAGEISFIDNKAYIDGLIVGGGICTVYIYANPIVGEGISYYSQISFPMNGSRMPAPEISVEIQDGKYIISMDTRDCDKVYYEIHVNGGGLGYTLDVNTDITNIEIIPEKPGRYSFTYQVRKKGCWTSSSDDILPVIQ